MTGWTPRRMRLAAAMLLVACVAALWTLGRLALSRLPDTADAPTAMRPPESLLHTSTTATMLPPLAPGKRMDVHSEYGLDAGTFTTTTTFPLHGEPAHQRGVHFHLINAGVVHTPAFQEANAMLVVVVFTDRQSWGPDRSVDALFAMLANTTISKTSVSLTLLTSNMGEFHAVRERLYAYISDYAQFSLLFRNDFKATDASTIARYQMLARYRNFAFLSTLETWHQHVVYMDPDVYAMPPNLLTKLTSADRDIIVPLCVRTSDPSTSMNTVQYDDKAYVTSRRQWRAFASDERRVRHRLSRFRESAYEWLALDSVGTKLLYVKADIHRQGVTFLTHARRGGADEDSGLCYVAHTLGYTCWGLPHEWVYHHYSDIDRW